MPSPPEKTEPTIEAILASLRAWLFRVVAFLAERLPLHRDDKLDLRVYLRIFEYDLKRAIFLRAVDRMTLPATPTRHRPGPGYALRPFRQSPLRFVTHGTFNRIPRELHARIAHLRAILDNVEAWTARLVKRLTRGFSGAWRILAAPPTERVAPHAPPLMPALADTS